MSVSDDPRTEVAEDDLPAALPSMGRVLALGYRAEPRLLVASLAMTALQALPDSLVALWLALLTDGILHGSRARLAVGALGLAASATLLWTLQVTLSRTTRRLGDRLNVMFQGHVAQLQARIPTVEHHERPELLDRIAVLRTGVFALDPPPIGPLEDFAGRRAASDRMGDAVRLLEHLRAESTRLPH